MNVSQFLRGVEKPEPVYVLVTEQEYIRKKILEHCRNQVDEQSRVFDWSVFDLQKESVADLVNQARTLPWASKRRWIYARNADQADDKLNGYLQQPSAKTVLILEARRAKPGWSALPRIEVPEKTDPLNWVLRKAAAANYEMDQAAAEALVELVGDSFEQLDAELEKQFLSQLDDRRITLDSVLEMTFQSRGYDIFALIEAIATGKGASALRILNRLYQDGMAAPQIVSMLYWNFRRLLVAREMLARGRPFREVLMELKIWSYKGREREIRRYPYERLVEVLFQLRDTDRLCKTTSTDPKTHLERVVSALTSAAAR
jgi:DNA polymerase III subunit delta